MANGTINNDIIMEDVSFGTFSFGPLTRKAFTAPAKPGYKAMVVRPYGSGSYIDIYGVVTGWSGGHSNGFSIANLSTTTTYSWSINAGILYVKI